MQSYFEFVRDLQIRNSSLIKKDVIKDNFFINNPEKLISYNKLQEEIVSVSNQVVLEYISNFIDLSVYSKHILFSTSDMTFADRIDFGNVRSLINFKTINEINQVNRHFCSVNKLLPDAGIYIGRVETYGERKIKLFNCARVKLSSIQGCGSNLRRIISV